MADKKISQLQLRSSFSGACSLPIDDGTQTYRSTGTQVLDYVSAFAPVTKTANATLSAAEFSSFILIDATSNDVAITLLAASAVTGKICRLKVISAGAYSASIIGTIDGVSGFNFSGIYDKASIYSNGTSFYFI